MATYIVARLAWEVPGDCWLRYDRTFCQAAAVNPALPWDRWDPDMWLADMVERSAPSSEGMAAAPRAQTPWPVPAFPILQPQDVLVVPVRVCYETCKFLHVCCLAPTMCLRSAQSSPPLAGGAGPTSDLHSWQSPVSMCSRIL